MVQELFRRAFFERLLAGMPLVVVEPPNQQRQLRTEMDRQSGLEAVPQRVQDGAQNMPGYPSVGPEFSHDLVEPDVGGLQRLVEHVEAGGAHVILHDRDLVLSFGKRALASAVPASLLFS